MSGGFNRAENIRTGMGPLGEINSHQLAPREATGQVRPALTSLQVRDQEEESQAA